MAGPGKALDHGRYERVHYDRLGFRASHDSAGHRIDAEQRRAGVVEVADGCRQAPRARVGCERSQSSQGKLHLNAALGAHELMPFVHDHDAQVGECLPDVGTREQERDALRRGDERGRESLALARTHARLGVAGTGLECPGEIEIAKGHRERLQRVGGKGAQWGDPEDPQRWRSGSPSLARRQCGMLGEILEQRTPPRSKRLAGAGGGMYEPTLAIEIGPPHFTLKVERSPAPAFEPLFG